MENASKALIIAGAILLAILLISLGIFIFTGAQDTAKNGGLDAQQAAAFNSAILKYEGQNKTASDVRAVKNEIIAANKKLTDLGQPTISITGTVTDTSLLEDKDRFTIKVDYSTSTGYISTVTITKKGT